MATTVLTNAFLTVNSVDLSDHVKSVSLSYEGEAIDETVMSLTTRKFKGGLKNWTLDVEFVQDTAASKVDATIFSLVGSTTQVEVRVDATAARSSTNPGFYGTGLITSYSPLGNSVGELAMAPVKIVAASSLSRVTT